MLGLHTKQINAYGKRARRVVEANSASSRPLSTVDIISIFDDLPPPPAKTSLASKMKKRENILPSKSSLKVVGLQKKKRLSPVFSPIKKKKLGRVTQIADDEVYQASPKRKVPAKPSVSDDADDLVIVSTSPRTPLAAVPINTPGSPAIYRGGRIPIGKTPLKSKSFAPLVDVDIIVLDDSGRTVSTEKRISLNRSASKLSPSVKHSMTSYELKPVSSTQHEESDNDIEIPSKQAQRTTNHKKHIVLSDDSESDGDYVSAKHKKMSVKQTKSVHRPSRPSSKPLSTTKLLVEVVVPPAPYRVPFRAVPLKPLSSSTDKLNQQQTPPPAQNPQYHPLHDGRHILASPLLRPRQLTPIRPGRKAAFEPSSPTSPSTPTDFDLSLNFSELNLQDITTNNSAYENDVPDYLLPLLEECHQETCGPHNFSTFIETFPYDPIFDSVRGEDATNMQFRKIGEASYSEVFGIGDVVLKVIPLRDETRVVEEFSEEGPAPSDAKDVRKEIIVTRAMGDVHEVFVKLLKAYVVKGKYPEVLLQLWDEFNEKEGSESIRPDSFKVSQVYAIIVLPNGGPDLEAYTFRNVTRVGWKQACTLFWQVAKALAHAEHLVSFEHRDLHWGQILVKNLPSQENALKSLSTNQKLKTKRGRIWMDDPSHGVQATIIDLGLSRMDAGDGNGGNNVHWTPFDDEVFMGEGDYQFDVYRMMRKWTGNAWEGFHPFTNVIWLHYLLRKLLFSKGLKPPHISRKSKAPTGTPQQPRDAFSEKDCYDCLVELESWLGHSVADLCRRTALPAKGKGRKKVEPLNEPSRSDGPARAGEVVVYGAKKGWIKVARLY